MERETRNILVAMRLSAHEHEKITRNATMAGMKPSTFARFCALSPLLVSAEDEVESRDAGAFLVTADELAKLRREITRALSQLDMVTEELVTASSGGPTSSGITAAMQAHINAIDRLVQLYEVLSSRVSDALDLLYSNGAQAILVAAGDGEVS